MGTLDTDQSLKRISDPFGMGGTPAGDWEELHRPGRVLCSGHFGVSEFPLREANYTSYMTCFVWFI